MLFNPKSASVYCCSTSAHICELYDSVHLNTLFVETDRREAIGFQPENRAASRAPPQTCWTSCTPDLQHRHRQQPRQKLQFVSLRHKHTRHQQIQEHYETNHYRVSTFCRCQTYKKHATGKTRTNSRTIQKGGRRRRKKSRH